MRRIFIFVFIFSSVMVSQPAFVNSSNTKDSDQSSGIDSKSVVSSAVASTSSEIEPLIKKISAIEDKQNIIPIIGNAFGDILNFVKFLLVIVLLIWFITRTQLKNEIISLLRRDIDLNFFGQQVSFRPSDVQKKIRSLELEALTSTARDLTKGTIPYVSDDATEKIVKKILLCEEIMGLELNEISRIPILKLIGNHYFMIRDYEKSMLYYGKVEKLNNDAKVDDYGMLNVLGYIYLVTKEYDKAHSYYQKMVKDNPELPWGFLGLHRVETKRGGDPEKIRANIDHAILLFNELIAKDEMDYMAHFGLASAYKRLGFYEKALNELNAVISIRPNFAPAHYNKAIMLLSKVPCDKEMVFNCLSTTFKINRYMKRYAVGDEDLTSIREHKCYKCILQEPAILN